MLVKMAPVAGRTFDSNQLRKIFLMLINLGIMSIESSHERASLLFQTCIMIHQHREEIRSDL